MFLRKAAVVASFFIITPLLLFSSVFLYAFRNSQLQTKNFFISLDNKNANVAYAALPSTTEAFDAGVIAGDVRVEKIKNFFNTYNSLLANYADLIVQNADKYGLDYRLLPSIAMQESIGCKKVHAGTNNCFGWGIYTHKITSFNSYEDSINTISKLMAQNYINKGLNTPEEIGPKYNPGNVNDWISKINFFMDKIQNQSIVAYLTNP